MHVSLGRLRAAGSLQKLSSSCARSALSPFSVKCTTRPLRARVIQFSFTNRSASAAPSPPARCGRRSLQPGTAASKGAGWSGVPPHRFPGCRTMLALCLLTYIRPRHRVYRNDRTTRASPRLPIFRRGGHSRSVRIAAFLPSRGTLVQEQVERRLIRTPALGRLGDYATYSSDGVLEPRPPANEPETVCPDGRWQFVVKSMRCAPTLQQARLVHLIEQGELQRARGRRSTLQSWPRLDQSGDADAWQTSKQKNRNSNRRLLSVLATNSQDIVINLHLSIKS